MDYQQLKQDFERDGVVAVPGVFDEAEMKELRERIDQYIEKYLPMLPPEYYVLEEDGKAIRNLWWMNLFDDYFIDFARADKAQGLIAKLVDWEPALQFVETFSKPAKVGSGVPIHQDQFYLCLEPAHALSFWLAVDPVTEENGPLKYVRGSHKQGTVDHEIVDFIGSSFGVVDPPDFEADNVFTPLLQPGDVLVHHCETIHVSGPNNSEQSRCGLVIGFRGAETKRNPEMVERYNSLKAAAGRD